MLPVEFRYCVDVPLNVTVPELCVNVPELVQEPPTVNVPEFDALNVELAEIVRSPFTSSVGSYVSAVMMTPVLVPLPMVRFWQVMVWDVAVPRVKVIELADGSSCKWLYVAGVILVADEPVYLTVELVIVNVPPAVIERGVPLPVNVKVSSVILRVSFAPIVTEVAFTLLDVEIVFDVPSIVTAPKSCPEVASDQVEVPVPSKVKA